MSSRIYRYLFLILLIFIISTVEDVFAGERVKIIILHTNDIHGHMLPYENSKIAPPPEQIAGFQYLSSLIKKEREENPDSVLLLDGGDRAQGTLYSNLAWGIPVMELMNYIGYDATVIGNHDLDWGYEKLNDMITATDFPVLSANVLTKNNENFIPGVKPFIIKHIKGIRIGIIGISTSDTTIMGSGSGFENYDFISPEITLKKYIPLLKKIYNVDLLILLSHMGYKTDLSVASEFPGIDIIVGGHSHTALKTPVLAGRTLIVQADKYMEYLGKLEIEFDTEKKEIVSYKGELMTISDGNLEPDAGINKKLNKYKEKYSSLATEVMGEASVELTHSKTSESSVGNFVTDIMRETCRTDIGLINSGGLREDIPAGKVTMEKIYSLFPFEDLLITLELKGKDIKDIMEKCADNQHGILQISGMKVIFDFSRPEGKRVVSITIKDKKLDPEATYSVATIDFLAQGGDGYDTFKNGKDIRNIMPLRDLIIHYFKEHSPVSGKIEGRIEILK